MMVDTLPCSVPWLVLGITVFLFLLGFAIGCIARIVQMLIGATISLIC
jgi:hypothetical protein